MFYPCSRDEHGDVLLDEELDTSELTNPSPEDLEEEVDEEEGGDIGLKKEKQKKKKKEEKNKKKKKVTKGECEIGTAELFLKK